jgi:small subunit ribosomal protein S4
MAKDLSASSVKKFRAQRRLNTDLPGLGKMGALNRRPYAPGQHGASRRKPSEYAIRLYEKQKVIAHYGLTERGLQRFVRDSRQAAINWISELSRRLELRLDNIVFRAQFANSIAAARQFVRHGHILVNGRRANIGSMVLKVDDVVSVAPASHENQTFLTAQQRPRLDLPTYMEKTDDFSVKVLTDPTTADVPFAYQERFVAEYYATRGRK